MTTELRPFFMWAGGKTRLLKSYAPLWPNLTYYDHYIEPFFGGGAVFCWVKNQAVNPFLSSVIGDSNSELMGVLAAVQSDPEKFIRDCMRLVRPYLKMEKPARKDWYYAQRKIYWSRPSASRLYVLMRTGFNGIWQTCQDSKGLFATPAGLLNQNSADRIIDKELIRAWSTALQGVTSHTGSYKTVPIPTSGRSLIYCDPPYRDSFTTYGTGFADADQVELSKWFREQASNGHKILMSNRCVEKDTFFEDLLEDIADFRYIDVIYTAGRRKVVEGGFAAKPAKEVLIISK